MAFTGEGKQLRKTAKQVKKHIKKLPKVLLAAVVVCLAAGICMGAGVCAYLSREDGFYLNGEKEITLSVGANYTEQGATAVSLSNDLSSLVTVDGEVDTSVPGVYYIVYRVPCYKYKDYRLVRKITVQEGGGNG